jgi:hypothetical protein
VNLRPLAGGSVNLRTLAGNAGSSVNLRPLAGGSVNLQPLVGSVGGDDMKAAVLHPVSVADFFLRLARRGTAWSYRCPPAGVADFWRSCRLPGEGLTEGEIKDILFRLT